MKTIKIIFKGKSEKLANALYISIITKLKEDKLVVIEDKFNAIQSQMQTVLSVLSSINTQEGKQEIAKGKWIKWENMKDHV